MRVRRGLFVLGVLTLGGAAGVLAGQQWLTRWLATTEPAVPALAVARLFVDDTPVSITVTADWRKIEVRTTADDLRSNPTLWRKMNFDDWDRVPALLRDEALDKMWTRYRNLILNSRRWDRMDAYDWDEIPQPIRTQAYLQMVRYWSGHYQVGARFGLARGTVTNTMGAIVMVESWFEHRAVSTSRSGNRDLGLGQASDFMRTTLLRLWREGAVDFTPRTDDEYFDPWKATRAVAIWFDLMLHENGGDIDAAIRAYHRGSPLAVLGEGNPYLANVIRKRRRFMRNEDSTPAWNFLFVRAAGDQRARASRPTAGRD